MIKTLLKILKSVIKSMRNRFLMIYGFNIPSLMSKAEKSRAKIKREPEIIDVEKLIDRLNNFQEVNENQVENIENPHEKELGEPHAIERFEEDGYIYEKSIWHVDGGTVVKVRIISTPFDVEDYEFVESVLTLEQKLKMAIRDERYEDAALIRDKINNLNKTTSGTTETN